MLIRAAAPPAAAPPRPASWPSPAAAGTRRGSSGWRPSTGAPVRFLGRVPTTTCPRSTAAPTCSPCCAAAGGAASSRRASASCSSRPPPAASPRSAGRSGGAAEAVVDGETGRGRRPAGATSTPWPTPSTRLLDDPERCAAPLGRGRPAAGPRPSSTYDVLGRPAAATRLDVPGPCAVSAPTRPPGRPAGRAGSSAERIVLGSAPSVRSPSPAAAVLDVGCSAAGRGRGRHVASLVLFAVGCVLSWSPTPAPSSAAAPTRSPSAACSSCRPRRARTGQAAAGLLLAVQVVVALVTALGSRPLHPLAFGVLVPVFGLGLHGLWARPPRRVPASPAPGAERPRAAPQRGRDRSRMQAMAEPPPRRSPSRPRPSSCFAVATDFPRYPEWAKDVKAADVLERDDEGRPRPVEFRASALGRSTHYTLATTTRPPPRSSPGSSSTATSCGRSTARTRFAPLGDGPAHRRRLRALHRAGRAPARLRQAAGRGADPQHGPRAEGPRRVTEPGAGRASAPAS